MIMSIAYNPQFVFSINLSTKFGNAFLFADTQIKNIKGLTSLKKL